MAGMGRSLRTATPRYFPFSSGGASTADVPNLYAVSLGGHGYIIDSRQYRRRTLPATRDAIDQAAEAGEQSLNPQGLWRRSQSDWTGGAGQEFFDRPDSVRNRFWTSKGVDAWTRGGLSLLPSTSLRRASVNTNLKALSVTAAGTSYLYVSDGSDLLRIDDPTPATWVPAATIAAGGAITDIATDGKYIYVARSGAALQRSAIGSGTMAAFGAQQPTVVAFANGRLIVAVGALLEELDNAGAVVGSGIMTHLNADFAWSAISAAPNAIYAGGNAGDRAEIYRVGIDSATGGLAFPVPAASLPPGELLYAMCFDPGSDRAMVLATSVGIRLALISDDGGLSYGPPITAPGAVRTLDAQGRFVHHGWSNYDATSTGLGRIDLSVVSAALTPAYASDLMATAQGVVTGVATFGAKRYFGVSGVGFFGQDTTKVASGELRSGWIDYGTVDRKVLSSFDMRHDALAGSVTASLHTEADTTAAGGTHIDVGTNASLGSFGPSTPFGAGQARVERVGVHLEITRSGVDTTLGPVLRRWTLRAIPAPTRTDEIILPIILRTEVTANNGGSVDFVPLEEFLFLKALEELGAAVVYQEGTSSYQVKVDQIEVQPEKWTDDSSFFEGNVVVRLLTVTATG